MPTATGPDGVKREISMEEFMQAMQNGGRLAYVQRTVTGPDGREQTSTIYGNRPGRTGGVDWSVNLFMDKETLNELIRIYLDPDREDDPEERLGGPDDTYAVTVDLTDSATMGELTVKKDEAVLLMSTRDEQRAPFGEPIRRRWEKDKEGNVSLDLSGLEEDATPLYLLGFMKALKYLKKAGLLDELKKLENRSAGAIVTAKENSGTISARIVRGRQRPDLPCITGFLGMGGEQVCRPYFDEMPGFSDMMPLEQRAELAEGGDTNMMESLAMAYLNGDGVDADPEQAAHWFQKLAEAGEPNGMFNLGLLYAKGHGVPRDFAQAAHWMEQAAAHGDTDAPPQAEKYRKMADGLQKAEAGDAQAQADLAAGLMSLGGSLDQAGAGDDYTQSVYWAQKAAEQNNGDGIWTLALAYEHGRGVAQDKKKAVELYRRGAELGHAPSQHSLGCYQMRGEVVPKDEREAFRLILKSAEQGYGLAMRDAGRCYQFGSGVQDDMEKAIEWYEKALQVIDDEELARKVAIFKTLDFSGGGQGGFGYMTPHAPELAIDWDCLVSTDRKVLANKRIAVTGEMAVFPDREKFKEFIASHGGWLTGSVSSKTDYLITNEPDSGSTKNRQAKQLGVKVISEKQFFDMLTDKKKAEAKEAADPAEQARRKAEKEAAEEKKRAQEQARKAEEEKKRQQEQAKEAAYKAWQEQAARCREQRAEEIKRLTDEKRGQLRAELESRRNAKLAEADKKLSALQEQKQAAEQTLASLGLFKMGAKKEKRAEIEWLSGEVTRAQQARTAVQSGFDRELKGLEQQLAGQRAAIERQANEKYPMPAEPEKPASVIEQEKKQQAQYQPSGIGLANQSLRDEIIASMAPGKYYTLFDIADMVPALNGSTPQRISGLLKPITNDPDQGIYDRPLNRRVEQRKAYFYLA